MIFNNFILPVFSSQIQFFPHYVIVHKEAATDVKVAASGNAHAQMLIKVQSLIAAVDIQFEGFSTAFLHGLLSSIEERLAISPALIFREKINLVQMKQRRLQQKNSMPVIEIK